MVSAAVLYIDEVGARIHKDHGRLIVEKNGLPIDEILLEHLEQLILCEACDCTGAALMALLAAGVDVTFLDYYGHYRGRVTSDLPRNSGLRLAQYRAFNDPP